MSLKMKYFVLNPKAKVFGDRFARASRSALKAYASSIRDIDPELAKALYDWQLIEREKEGRL